jgi:FkbM family methyltransferase
MRIFIDVGGHYGETLRFALDPQWGFDRIYSIEPCATCVAVLRSFSDKRLRVEPIALSDHNGTAELQGAGLRGGSLYADKRVIERNEIVIRAETITLVRASEWFAANIPADAEVYLKMNCEGSEVDILSDLLDSGELVKITSAYIDFDIRKVAGQEHRQGEMEARLSQAGIRYVTPEEKGITVATWLARDCPRLKTSWRKALSHHLRLDAPMYARATHAAKLLLPRQIYRWIGHRYGRMARNARSA